MFLHDSSRLIPVILHAFWCDVVNAQNGLLVHLQSGRVGVIFVVQILGSERMTINTQRFAGLGVDLSRGFQAGQADQLQYFYILIVHAS